MKKYILASKYAEKVNCILPKLERLGVKSVTDLDNLPVYVGSKLCQEDIYQFVAELRDIMLNWVEPKPKKTSKAKLAKVEVETVEEQQEET